MAVPFPKICSVLAHELRSPLSVLQGYIRLLQQHRDADHPETPMLQAMLDATGRLTAIARQASDLGAWMTRDASNLIPVLLADVLEEAHNRASEDGTVRVVRTEAADTGQIRADAPVLAGALVALAQSMARETGCAAVEITAIDGKSGGAFSLRARPSAGRGDAESGPAAIVRAMSLDRGGVGLALIAASYVLDAHGASLEVGQVPDSIDIHFRDTGGAL